MIVRLSPAVPAVGVTVFAGFLALQLVDGGGLGSYGAALFAVLTLVSAGTLIQVVRTPWLLRLDDAGITPRDGATVPWSDVAEVQVLPMQLGIPLGRSGQPRRVALQAKANARMPRVELPQSLAWLTVQNKTAGPGLVLVPNTVTARPKRVAELAARHGVPITHGST